MKKFVFISLLLALSLVYQSPRCQTLRAFASNTGPYCSGASVQLLGSHNLNNNSLVNYRWKGPNGYASLEKNPNDASFEGIYTLYVQTGNKMDSARTEVIFSKQLDSPTIFGLTKVCENATLELQVPYYQNVTYVWKNPYHTTVSFANSLVLSGIKDSLSGFYNVEVKGACYLKSAKIEVSVQAAPEAIVIDKPNAFYCVGESLELNAKVIENATYEWFNAGNQKISSQSQLKIPYLTEKEEQLYLSVSKNGCSSALKSIPIPIVSLPQNSVIANKSKLCEGDTLTIETTLSDSLMHYHWTFPNSQNMESSRESKLIFSNVKPSQSGIYTLKVEKQGCVSKATQIAIEVLSKPTLLLEKEVVLCDEKSVEIPLRLVGNVPFKLTYHYGKEAEKTFIATTNFVKMKAQIIENQYFVPTFLENNNALCRVEIRDSTLLKVLHRADKPITKPDEFIVAENEWTKEIDILKNDIFSSSDSIFIHKKPLFGKIIQAENGKFSYSRGDNDAKNDEFEYEICNNINTCNRSCSTAKVHLILENDPLDPKVFVPEAITPNGDGKNDWLQLTGLEKYPENELTIFNRWGNLVYQVQPYAQNWDATLNNQPLPNGAYYYVLRVNQTNKRVLKGVIYVFRD